MWPWGTLKLMLTCFFLQLHSQSTTGIEFNFVQPATLTDPIGNVCVGTSAIFNCTVQIISGGVPITVNAEWRRNNTVINSSTPRHTLLKTTSESRTLITTGLRVDNTTLNDNDAVYTCTTNGAPGNFNTSVILSVTGGPPSPNSNISVNDICLTYTIVSWIPFSSIPECGSVSYDVIISPSDGVTLINITDTSYNFTGLTPNTNYSVTVFGSNKAGDGESITAGYHVPTSEVRNLIYREVADGNNASLIVTWDPAVNPSCGGVLVYLVTLSSSHQGGCNVKDNIITVTDLSNLSATFSNLRSIAYNGTVAAVSRTGVGETSMFMIIITRGINESMATESDSDSENEVLIIIVISVSVGVLVIYTLIIIIILYCKHFCNAKKDSKVVVDNINELNMTEATVAMEHTNSLEKGSKGYHAAYVSISGAVILGSSNATDNSSADNVGAHGNTITSTDPAYGNAATNKMNTDPAYGNVVTNKMNIDPVYATTK